MTRTKHLSDKLLKYAEEKVHQRSMKILKKK